MSRKENYRKHFAYYFDEFFKSNDEEKLREYLLSNSNLPGPRGNLELAYAFAETVENYATTEPERMWSLCQELISVSSEAPTNDPREFLAFCGTLATGSIGSISSVFFQKALSRLQEFARDPRWRTREAVAMGLQRLLAKQSQKSLNALEEWIRNDNWLVMRAIAAGVAEPALLGDEQTARQALELHKKIFAHILSARQRKSEEFKTLRQGLGYTLSVVTVAIPKEGFEYVRLLVNSRDTDVLWIIKENLKKNRLTKNFPNEVAQINKLLQE